MQFKNPVSMTLLAHTTSWLIRPEKRTVLVAVYFKVYGRDHCIGLAVGFSVWRRSMWNICIPKFSRHDFVG